jgi:hypothetical protein
MGISFRRRHGASIQHYRAERHLCFLWLDAENDKILSTKALIETRLVKQVFLVSEAELSVSLVGDPLARSLGVKVRQVAQERL